MAIRYNNNDVRNFFYENQECEKVYWNSNLVFQKASISPFFFESVNDDAVYITLSRSSSVINKNIQASWDGVTWSQWNFDSAKILDSAGKRIYIKSSSTDPLYESSYYIYFNIQTFGSSNGKVRLGGKINSLFNNTIPEYACYKLFNRSGMSKITDITEIVFPATTASSCYSHMFEGCTLIEALPELPATTLAQNCYNSMFKGCTNVRLSTTQAPGYTTEYRIPTSGTGSTGTDSLTDMFANTSGTFTGTPSINTTYYESIGEPPVINYFYIECLTESDNLANVYLADGNTGYYPDLLYSRDKTNWSTFDTTPVSMTAGDKIYIKAPVNGNDGINNSTSGTNHFSFNHGTYKIGGDITTLVRENGCTDLSQVGTGIYCFGRFCQGESGLTSISDLILPPVTGHTSFHYAFYQSSITNFPDMSHITTVDYNTFGSCFRDTQASGAVDISGITTYNNTPSETNQYAFNHCFRNSGITAVTIGSALPPRGAYNSAFYLCSSLTSVTVGWTQWGATDDGTYQNWLRDVSGSGTFYCPSALGDNSTIQRDNTHCPSGWTVVNI